VRGSRWDRWSSAVPRSQGLVEAQSFVVDVGDELGGHGFRNGAVVALTVRIAQAGVELGAHDEPVGSGGVDRAQGDQVAVLVDPTCVGHGGDHSGHRRVQNNLVAVGAVPVVDGVDLLDGGDGVLVDADRQVVLDAHVDDVEIGEGVGDGFVVKGN